MLDTFSACYGICGLAASDSLSVRRTPAKILGDFAQGMQEFSFPWSFLLNEYARG